MTGQWWDTPCPWNKVLRHARAHAVAHAAFVGAMGLEQRLDVGVALCTSREKRSAPLLPFDRGVVTRRTSSLPIRARRGQRALESRDRRKGKKIFLIYRLGKLGEKKVPKSSSLSFTCLQTRSAQSRNLLKPQKWLTGGSDCRRTRVLQGFLARKRLPCRLTRASLPCSMKRSLHRLWLSTSEATRRLPGA